MKHLNIFAVFFFYLGLWLGSISENLKIYTVKMIPDGNFYGNPYHNIWAEEWLIFFMWLSYFGAPFIYRLFVSLKQDKINKVSFYLLQFCFFCVLLCFNPLYWCHFISYFFLKYILYLPDAITISFMYSSFGLWMIALTSIPIGLSLIFLIHTILKNFISLFGFTTMEKTNRLKDSILVEACLIIVYFIYIYQYTHPTTDYIRAL